MQVALQGLYLERVIHIVHPALQGRPGTLDDVEAFLKENLDQLGVTLFPSRSRERVQRFRFGRDAVRQFMNATRSFGYKRLRCRAFGFGIACRDS